MKITNSLETIQPHGKASFDRYIDNRRYLDESIKKFIETSSKAEGFTIILWLCYTVIIYEFPKNIIVHATVLEKDQITDFDTLNWQRTPIYSFPGTNTKVKLFQSPTGQNRYETYILNY